FFGTSYEVYRAVMAAGRADGKYPFDVPEYRRRHVPGLDSLLGIRDGALVSATSFIAEKRSAAMTQLGFALGILLLGIVVTLGVVVVCNRRLVSPLAALTHTIVRIAERDHSVDVPAQNRTDEIGKMAAAIETLRRNAIEAEEMASRSLAEETQRRQ